jgi:chromosome segregation ATPase
MIRILEESKSDLRQQTFNQSEKIRELEDALAAAQQSNQAQAADEVEGEAAKINRENAEAQIAHLQNKTDSLEEQLQQMQMDAQNAAELNKKLADKAKESDRRLHEDLAASREAMAELREQSAKARARTAEVERALKDNGSALEAARAEVERLRSELAVRQISDSLSPPEPDFEGSPLSRRTLRA